MPSLIRKKWAIPRILPDFFLSLHLKYLALQRELFPRDRSHNKRGKKKETKNAHCIIKWGKSTCRLPYREQTSDVKLCITKFCTYQACLRSIAWNDALRKLMCRFPLSLRMGGISINPISSINYAKNLRSTMALTSHLLTFPQFGRMLVTRPSLKGLG